MISKRIFPDRYEYNPVEMEYLDKRENKFLCPDEIEELLNECNELKIIYSCDINASNYMRKKEKEARTE